MVLSKELKPCLPLSWRSDHGMAIAMQFVTCGLICATIPVAIFFDVKSDTTLVAYVVCLLIYLFFLAIGIPGLYCAITEWWKRNHDGYVMIITRSEHKLLSDGGLPDVIAYVSGYKRVSEFRHVPIEAYKDALLVALNPKRRDVHFENGRMAGCLPTLRDGRFEASFGGCVYFCDDVENIWALMKENTYTLEMHDSTEILRKFHALDDERVSLTNFLLTIEERLANAKTFGRAVGAADLRWSILKSIEMRHPLPQSLRERYEGRLAEYVAAQEKRNAQKAAAGVALDSSGAPEN